ncbi:MAG TPA: hypothetical protein VEL07_20420 [Planctomycetota bacterium]|nr:hypothetical protein [Planctomycetota bacterium]
MRRTLPAALALIAVTVFASEADVRSPAGATRPEPTATAGVATPLPDAAATRAAVAELKKLYKDEYGLKKAAQKRAFADKLRHLARSGRDAPATRHAALTEALALSVAANDLAGAVEALDALALGFEGFDAVAERRAALARIDAPAAKALIRLLDDPLDQAACGDAGRYFCLEASRWDLGLPLLVACDDAALVALAASETDPPSDPTLQLALADGWFDAAGKLKNAQKVGAGVRAHDWYAKAMPSLTGVGKERASQRIADLFAVIPDDKRDYARMTAKQWDKLRNPSVTVDVRSRADSKITLKPGQRLRIVPHPDDTWTFTWGKSIPSTVGWQGDEMAGRFVGRDKGNKKQKGILTPGALCWQLDDGETREVEIGELIEGTGRLGLTAYDPGKDGENGELRVKLVVIDAD